MKKQLLLLVIMMLSMGAQAGEVLYAEIDGTNMSLKCGESAPDGTAKYTGSDEWSRSFSNTITTATIDASCTSYSGTTLAWLFCGFTQLETITSLNNLNTTNVTSMMAMFCDCNALTSLDLSSFNTANVTIMAGMFFQCTKLTTIYANNWDTDNVAEGSDMFVGCTSQCSSRCYQ